jgi:Ca-activated chloride channel homolog
MARQPIEGRRAFRGRWSETLWAIRLPLCLLGGGALSLLIVGERSEPKPKTDEIPDRFVKMLSASSDVDLPLEADLSKLGSKALIGASSKGSSAEASPLTDDEQAPDVVSGLSDAKKQEVLNSSKLLLKIIGTTGASSGPVQNLWSDEEQGLGDIDAALAETSGETSGETWPSYGVNGIISTAVDALATFSIDVDTASWTRVRRALADGYLPAAGMVRVEEFVNYFRYDYVPPVAGEPFAAHIEGAPSPWADDRHLVAIGLQGRRVSVFDRKPANLTFLVDVSCSMQSRDKLPLVRESLHMLTDALGDGDTVALVTYAGTSSVVLPPTSAVRSDEIHGAIDRLSTSGSTAMADGIFTAYALAMRSARPGSIDRVVIASDGDANVGPSKHEQITPTIQSYAKRGITLTTLGFGTGNYRDHTMEQLANDGDGNYFYIDGEREARRVLVSRLVSTLEVIARDVKIQVAWDRDVVLSHRLLGYENRAIADEDFRDDAVDAGEVGAGHQVTAIFELQLANDHGSLGALSLRYKRAGPDAPSSELSWPIDAEQLRPSLAETSADFRTALAAAQLAEVLRRSPPAEEISLASIEELAQGARRPEYDQEDELVTAIRRARQLRGPAHL